MRKLLLWNIHLHSNQSYQISLQDAEPWFIYIQPILWTEGSFGGCCRGSGTRASIELIKIKTLCAMLYTFLASDQLHHHFLLIYPALAWEGHGCWPNCLIPCQAHGRSCWVSVQYYSFCFHLRLAWLLHHFRSEPADRRQIFIFPSFSVTPIFKYIDTSLKVREFRHSWQINKF